MNYIKTYLVTFVIFFAIDIVWLGFVAKKMYAKYLGYIMSPKVNWTAAILFYLVFIAGLIFFALNPALQKESFTYALLAGAFFGFITYATYDMTNLATLKDWPVIITVVDLLWGTFLCSATSSVSFLILKYLF